MSLNPNNDNKSDWLQFVRKNIAPVDFGSIQIVVHDSKVVQIDTKHKVRLAKSPIAGKKGSETTTSARF